MSRSVSRFFNWAMIAIGGLIVALAGPCTAMFAGGALFSLASSPGERELAGLILAVALVVGGIPLAGGVTLLVVGLRTLRAERQRASQSKAAASGGEGGSPPPR